MREFRLLLTLLLLACRGAGEMEPSTTNALLHVLETHAREQEDTEYPVRVFDDRIFESIFVDPNRGWGSEALRGVAEEFGWEVCTPIGPRSTCETTEPFRFLAASQPRRQGDTIEVLVLDTFAGPGQPGTVVYAYHLVPLGERWRIVSSRVVGQAN